MSDYITVLLSSSVISSLITLAGGYFIVNKKDAEFKNMLEKKKKIAEIYYEERAEVLQKLYRLLVVRNNDMVNLMKFLGEIARGNEYATADPFILRYENFKETEVEIQRILLYSALFLKEKDHLSIKEFYNNNSTPVPYIVDLFELYYDIPDLRNKNSEEFKVFSQKVLDVELGKMFKEQIEETKKFGDLVKIIKNAIASDEIS
ncbi:hypothetical protein [Lactococcus garvieae]|uniref:hypothetical protein n=1 Tax=Lactococcus garvieae TaxID=1363 RepID=UPI0022E92FF1|nr:hypothetical protein [Lactococcus garvieae]